VATTLTENGQYKDTQSGTAEKNLEGGETEDAAGTAKRTNLRVKE
jgi:hypothetical protein